ncbi:hypothetical protein V8G54_002268 [Vigna mungo]|uniref:Ubiquitin-like protease family profile domain-containing protein n=1 Tax=Vigna mungo TaxID=3915 RepID=A0AAQ3S8Y7_VIGMU
MESSKSKWQVRAWMDTSYTVHMNSLLQARHVRRISETPFKCCLGIVEPIDLNLKLLKKLHQSFRVRQQLVSFDVVDVVMTLGLGIGGLEISFDESIVGKVGELFNSSKTKARELINTFDNIVGDDDLDVDVVCRLNSRHVSNMPCVVLDDLDSLYNYDWSGATHTYLVHSLNRCNKKLLTGKIVDSISISGSVVVLQLWVYECLGLHSHSSCKVFPRLKRFRPLNYGIEAIDLLFRKGKVHFDWYLRSVDRQNPIIRAAFNMDVVARTEEAPEKGENSCESARAARLEKVRKNNQKIKSLKDEIVAIRKALSERRKTGNFHQNISVDEAGVDVEGEGNEGGVQEAAVDETVADEAAAYEGVVDEATFDETAGDEDDVHEEETAAAPVDEAVVAATPVDEAAADEQPVHQAVANEQAVDEAIADEDVLNEVPPRDPLAFVDISGDDEDDDLIPHVQPLLVEPLTTILGDLTTTVDLDKLYHFMTQKDIAVRHVWQLIDYQPYFRHDLVRVEDLLFADWVFIPVVSNNHWWCYALKVCTMQFFVIDSLDKGIRGRGGIDRSIAKNIQQFWGLLTNTYEDSKIAFNVEQAKIPVQPNTGKDGICTEVGACSLVFVTLLPSGCWGLRWLELGWESTSGVRFQQLARVIAYKQAVSDYQQLPCIIAYKQAVSDYMVRKWDLYRKLVAAPWFFKRCSQLVVCDFHEQLACVIAYKQAVSNYQVRKWILYRKLVDAPWFFKRCSQLVLGQEDVHNHDPKMQRYQTLCQQFYNLAEAACESECASDQLEKDLKCLAKKFGLSSSLKNNIVSEGGQLRYENPVTETPSYNSCGSSDVLVRSPVGLSEKADRELTD